MGTAGLRHHKVYFDTLVEADTRPTYYEAVKFNVEGSLDFLTSMQRNLGSRLRDKDCDILLGFKGVGRSTGYPEKGNKYYWNKKGQPKLWKLRYRLKMWNISKWERDSLFPMNYKKE